jgi:hypothetical protein
VFQAYVELFDGVPDGEQIGKGRLTVGFHCWPDTAEEFVRDFIANRAGGT